MKRTPNDVKRGPISRQQRATDHTSSGGEYPRLKTRLQMFVAVACLGLATPVIGDDAPLIGYGNVKLGMTVTELMSVTQIKARSTGEMWPKDPYDPDYDWSSAVTDDANPQQVAGLSFHTSYYIEASRVVLINLTSVFPDYREHCLGRTKTFYDLLSTKYGSFDQPPQQPSSFPEEALGATKTYPDRSLTLQVQNEIDATCRVIIMYTLKFTSNDSDTNKL